MPMLELLLRLVIAIVFVWGFLYLINTGGNMIYKADSKEEWEKRFKEKQSQIPITETEPHKQTQCVPMDVIYGFGYMDLTPKKKEEKKPYYPDFPL